MNKLKHTGIKISDYPSSISNVNDFPHKLEHNHYFITYAPTYFGASTINKNYKIPLEMLRKDQKFYIGINNAKGDWQNLLNIWSGDWFNEDKTESYVSSWEIEERGSNDYIKNKYGLETDEDKTDRIFFIKDAPIPFEETHIDPNPASNKFVNKKYIDDRFNGIRKISVSGETLAIRPYSCVYEFDTTPTVINIIDTETLQDGRTVAECLENNILTFILKFPVSDGDELGILANGKGNVKWSYPTELADVLDAARKNNNSDVWIECFVGYTKDGLSIRCSNALNPMPGSEKTLETTESINLGNKKVPLSDTVYNFVNDFVTEKLNEKVDEVVAGDFISVKNNNHVSVKTASTISNDNTTVPTTQAVFNHTKDISDVLTNHIHEFNSHLESYNTHVGVYNQFIKNHDAHLDEFNDHVQEYNEHIQEYNEHIESFDNHIQEYNEHIETFGNHINELKEHVDEFDEHVTKFENHINNIDYTIHVTQNEKTKWNNKLNGIVAGDFILVGEKEDGENNEVSVEVSVKTASTISNDDTTVPTTQAVFNHTKTVSNALTNHIDEFNSHVESYNAHVGVYNQLIKNHDAHVEDFNDHVQEYNEHIISHEEHINNHSIHVTEEEKTRWDNTLNEVVAGDFISVKNNNHVSVKTASTISNDNTTVPTTQAVFNHTNNSTIHVTSSDKTNWNSKVSSVSGDKYIKPSGTTSVSLSLNVADEYSDVIDEIEDKNKETIPNSKTVWEFSDISKYFFPYLKHDDRKDYILYDKIGNPMYISFVHKLTNGNNMFFGKTQFTSVLLDFPELIDGSSMFQGCSNLITFGTETLNIEKLENGSNMFKGCSISAISVEYILEALKRTKTQKTNCVLDISSPNWEKQVIIEMLNNKYNQNISIDNLDSITQSVINNLSNEAGGTWNVTITYR